MNQTKYIIMWSYTGKETSAIPKTLPFTGIVLL